MSLTRQPSPIYDLAGNADNMMDGIHQLVLAYQKAEKDILCIRCQPNTQKKAYVALTDLREKLLYRLLASCHEAIAQFEALKKQYAEPAELNKITAKLKLLNSLFASYEKIVFRNGEQLALQTLLAKLSPIQAETRNTLSTVRSLLNLKRPNNEPAPEQITLIKATATTVKQLIKVHLEDSEIEKQISNLNQNQAVTELVKLLETSYQEAADIVENCLVLEHNRARVVSSAALSPAVVTPSVCSTVARRI